MNRLVLGSCFYRANSHINTIIVRSIIINESNEKKKTAICSVEEGQFVLQRNHINPDKPNSSTT